MSSAYENCIITSQDLKMLQSVLEGLGYDSHTMDDEVILYNSAARKVIQALSGWLDRPRRYFRGNAVPVRRSQT